MELQCYSRLNLLLGDKDLTIPELHRELEARGVRTNIKSLYRLNNPLASVEKIDAKIAGQICDLMGIDLSALFKFREKLDLTKMNRLSPRKEKHLADLLDKNREGQLTEAQKKELAHLIEEAEALMLHNAKALATQRRLLRKSSPSPRVRYKKGA